MRKAAEDAGIALTGLHWLLLAPEGMSITSESSETRRFTLETVSPPRRPLRRARRQICRSWLAGPAHAGQPGGKHEDRGKRHGLFFEGVAKASEAAGITYLLEPLSPEQTNFVTIVAEAAEIVRRHRLARLHGP